MAAVALNAAQGTALAGYGPAKAQWLLLVFGVAIAGWALAVRARRTQERLPGGGTPTQARIASLVVPGIAVMAAATVVGLAVLGTRGLQTPPIQPPTGIAAPSAPGGNAQPTPIVTSGAGDKQSGSSSPIDFQALLEGFLALLAVALLVLVAVFLARWLSARRRSERADGTVDGGLRGDGTEEALADAVLAGREALADDPDPRTAIIACYAAMERSLAHGGISRRKADTPTDLLRRAAEAGLVQGAAAQTLTDLFREARYSTHPLGEAQRDQARTALESIGAHLARAAAEADARFGAREETVI
ncbi:DUF4129 domain-containing protein [Streptacidiphilus pinicola]|uniref:DUF4129 domain-containing protein n=2 Tax=Streptacidiphilus pinicola TaxID=2219663 RepID=A0A2X0J5T6_9ACTN|nr:DUF4129 domain-containing protein [Streptacidiphilus pinicola]